MIKEKVFFNGKFGKICGVFNTVNSKKEIIILVHGFSSNKGTSAKINSNILNKLKINTLRIDLDNRGESDLDFKSGVCIPNYVKQVEASLDFVKEKGFKEISLLGTSFGGIVVLSTALIHPEIKKLFLRAPVLDWQKHAQRKFGENLERYRKKGILQVTQKGGEIINFSFNCYDTAKDYSMFEHAVNIKQPIMIIQGDADESVDYKVAKDIVSLFPNAKLEIIKGAGHNLGVNNNFIKGINFMKEFFKNQ